MSVFVDTSAFYAVVARGDARHEAAARVLPGLLDAESLVTHTYVAVETISLVHARHGPGPLPRVRALLDACERVVVDDDLHDAALDELERSPRTGPSFVDHVSFALMRRLDLGTAFAYDDDFATAGFRLVG